MAEAGALTVCMVVIYLVVRLSVATAYVTDEHYIKHVLIVTHLVRP
jgi:hypothetical protein